MCKKLIAGCVSVLLLLMLAVPTFACEGKGVGGEISEEVLQANAAPRYVPCPVGPGVCVYRLKTRISHFGPDGRTIIYLEYIYECLNCGGKDIEYVYLN